MKQLTRIKNQFIFNPLPSTGISVRLRDNDLDKLGQPDKALKVYDYAIQIDSNDSDSKAWEGKGDTLVKLGRSEEAIKAYNKAIEINPQNSEALNKKNTLSKHMK